jgi:nicotinamidase-related amidase
MAKRAETAHVAEIRSRRVLLLVDVIHHFECEDGALLHERTRAIVPALVKLRRAARAAGVPVIYVNDHFGRWRSSWEQTVGRATRARRGDVARRLRPGADDWFVLKPGRSAFHQTPLEALLDMLGAREITLAGITSDMCLLASASDALQHRLRCRVPVDTSTSLDDERHERAMWLMRTSMKVDTRPSTALAWGP